MAEIDEPPQPTTTDPHQTPQTPLQSGVIADPNPDNTRSSKPGIKRLIMISTVLFSFILGLPFLLKSIEIYRSPLPFRDIELLGDRFESSPRRLPCKFQAVFLGFEGGSSGGFFDVEKLGFVILDEMRELSRNNGKCGGCDLNYTVSVTAESEAGCVTNQGSSMPSLWQCGSFSELDDRLKEDDESVDEWLDSMLGKYNGDLADGGKMYTVVVMSRDEEARIVVGKHRHAWIRGNFGEKDAVDKVANIFVKYFMNGGKEDGLVKGEFMPVGADGRIVLSFSLLNADPQHWIYNWNFERIEEVKLFPIIKVLASVANISVESQVLYHTPKSSFSYWDEKLSSFIFSTKDLPFFVNSNEWHLDTSIAAGGRSKVLQFVVYIPSAEECPLLLQLPNGEISSTNGFISPMWGGVVVWNPSDCEKIFTVTLISDRKAEILDIEMMEWIAISQLRQNFDDSSEPSLSPILLLQSTVRFSARWELIARSFHETWQNLMFWGTIQISSSKLKQSRGRGLIIGKIRHQVMLSLQAANLAENNASLGIYEASTVSSRQARALAEDAFFHPSIMSISYYSFEHCFAIYTPFFLPVLLHVVLAAVKEWKRYKKEQAKYLAGKSKAKAE
ncbi:hypothetical protein Syun_007674 [Stephania yunnanensis]|uniref:GPI transamidase component PIG-S n=1 Tax=Stephania yunnanensis TaxID=152371 RepID=A0AAP0PYY7_9MAGN